MTLSKKLLWVSIFGIAMAFLETAVVVYLRKLYFPEGFDFPLTSIDSAILETEFLREVGTIFMLLAIGILVGRNTSEKFAWFIYSFAVWDIFYYVFLKALLNWPDSLLTWDVLFLVPMVWTGPVLAPLISAITMMFLAIAILNLNRRKELVLTRINWVGLTLGSLITIVSYAWDYLLYALNDPKVSVLVMNMGDDLELLSQSYIPSEFNWWLFLVGEMLILTTTFLILMQKKTCKIT